MATDMVFQPAGPGPGPRTAYVKIVQNKRGKFCWESGTIQGLKWFGQSIDAQRDAVATYGRDIEITDEKGKVRYIP